MSDAKKTIYVPRSLIEIEFLLFFAENRELFASHAEKFEGCQCLYVFLTNVDGDSSGGRFFTKAKFSRNRRIAEFSEDEFTKQFGEEIPHIEFEGRGGRHIKIPFQFKDFFKVFGDEAHLYGENENCFFFATSITFFAVHKKYFKQMCNLLDTRCGYPKKEKKQEPATGYTINQDGWIKKNGRGRGCNGMDGSGITNDVVVSTIKDGKYICIRFYNNCWKIITPSDGNKFVQIQCIKDRIYFKESGVDGYKLTTRDKNPYFNIPQSDIFCGFVGRHNLKYDKDNDLYYIEEPNPFH